MENWTIHDISLTGQQVPWFYDSDAPKYPGIDWSHPTSFIQKMLAAMADGEEDMKEKFEKNEGEKPEGPFTNPTQLPCGGIDPAIFIDDDGQAYYYWGQLFSHGVKLNEDMISFDPENIVDDLVTEEEHFFHEGSSMRKIGDMYYYVYADKERGKPTSLGYSTGKSPLGPFAYQGIIIDNDGCDPESWNNHGSIENVNGQWYVFYHRCSRGVQQHRRLCIEPITIHEDGTIDEVKMTSQGVGEPFAPHEPMMGYQACQMKGSVYIGLSTEEEKKNGYEEKLMNLSAGDEMVFRYVKNSASWSETEITYTGSGKIRVHVISKTDARTQKEKKENAGCQTKAGEVICSAEGGTEGPERKIQTAWGKTEIPAGTYEVVLDVEESNALEILAVTLH